MLEGPAGEGLIHSAGLALGLEQLWELRSPALQGTAPLIMYLSRLPLPSQSLTDHT